ncbi:unnamed protein product [Adineta ricciae]|uniref:Transmembrane protein n=1 Tax=Adineta ricciae TaxID=249248 RepID=A0A815C8N3_ADIRI|nr:unnamed protein product [Adineta ricciae]CAF1277141.1 unnamed protein product [Adineta ricciae]
MIDHSHAALKPEVIAQENEVYRRQKFLFVLIDILFTFDLVILIACIHLYTVDSWMKGNVQIYFPLFWILSSTIYDIYGLIVSCLCYRTCLLVYAWIGIFFFICNVIALGIMLFLPLSRDTLVSNGTLFYTPRYIILIIFWLTMLTLRLTTVRLSFYLTKLISQIEHDVLECAHTDVID